MSRNIKKFANKSAYLTYRQSVEYEEPHVSLIGGEPIPMFNDITYGYESVPLTVEMLEDGIVYFASFNGPISYSINNGTWITEDNGDYNISLSKGDEISFKGEYGLYSTPWNTALWVGSTDGDAKKFNLKGNIMSIYYEDNFESQTTTPVGRDGGSAGVCGAFAGIFSENSGLISANRLILPATTLTEDVYASMFSDCHNLKYPPKILPATTLSYRCYSGMFYNCYSLIEAPVIAATTLAEECCYSMFQCCESLTKAPELQATTLVDGCYSFMFNGCYMLNYIKALFLTDPANTLCTVRWVFDVSDTGTFIMNNNAVWNLGGVNGIPEGWNAQLEDGTPVIPSSSSPVVD